MLNIGRQNFTCVKRNKVHYTKFYRASELEIIRPKPTPIHVDSETLEG